MNVELTKMAELGFFRSFYTLKKKFSVKMLDYLGEKLLLLTFFWTPLFYKNGHNFCQLSIPFFQETSKKNLTWSLLYGPNFVYPLLVPSQPKSC